MATMPRINKKCQKIAYAILGEPLPLKSKPTKKQQEIDHYILYANNMTSFRYRL